MNSQQPAARPSTKLVVAALGLATAVCIWKVFDLRANGHQNPPNGPPRIILDRQVSLPFGKTFEPGASYEPLAGDEAAILFFHSDPSIAINPASYQFAMEYAGRTVPVGMRIGPPGHFLVGVPRGYGRPPANAECVARYAVSRYHAVEIGRWPLAPMPPAEKLITSSRLDRRISAKLVTEGAGRLDPGISAKLAPEKAAPDFHTIRFTLHGPESSGERTLTIRKLTYESMSHPSRGSEMPFVRGSVDYYSFYGSDQESADVEVGYTNTVTETRRLIVPKVRLMNYRDRPYLDVMQSASVTIAGYGVIIVPAQRNLPSLRGSGNGRDVWLGVQTVRTAGNLVSSGGESKLRGELVSPKPEDLNLNGIHLPFDFAVSRKHADGPIRYGEIGPLIIDLKVTRKVYHHGFETTIPIERR